MGLELDGVNGIIKNSTSDGDVTIKGNDGGSEISLLAFDVSAEGTAVFNSTVTVGSSLLINGTTPTLTIGDAGAEDTKIVFDGNAVDFVVGLDDSADEFRIGVGSGLGSDRVFEINSSGVSTFQKAVHFAGSTPTVTVGDGGAEDAKILFDGNAQNFHIGLDDSTDKLTIGLGNNLGTYPGFTMDENTNVEFPDNSVTIIASGNNDNLTLKTTDTDADIGPNLRLYRAVTGAASDAIGTIDWAAQDAGGGLTDYASAAVTITDATDGSEDGTLTLKVMNAGALNQMLTISGPETVVNEGSKDHDFRVESNDSTHGLFVDAGNNRIGIGTSSPDYTLHIRSMGSPSNDTILDLEGNATDANCGIQFTNSAGTLRGRILYDTDDNNLQFNVSAAERARINGNGNMSIGTSVELGRLHLRMPTTAGTDPVIHFSDAAGDDCGSIDLNASANTVAYTTSSDYRLKENVNYLWDATTELKKLKPAKFNFKADADTTVEGFLAHEVSDIVPIAVTGEKDAVDEDGNMVVQGIDQSKLVPLLVKTVQELEARITTLEG